jgi:hypothetical protein
MYYTVYIYMGREGIGWIGLIILDTPASDTGAANLQKAGELNSSTKENLSRPVTILLK